MTKKMKKRSMDFIHAFNLDGDRVFTVSARGKKLIVTTWSAEDISALLKLQEEYSLEIKAYLY